MKSSEILKSYGFSFNKGLGQNFIFDLELLGAIVDEAHITKEDTVLEIGAGAGTLTKALSDKAKKVIAFEIDRNLIPVLEASFKNIDNVQIVFKDFLRASKEEIIALCGDRFKVVANLPYYITTPVIMALFDMFSTEVSSISVMVQKEVAERITAPAGDKEYSSVSATVQARANVSITRIVPRTVFTPQPSVDSAMLYIQPDPDKFGEPITKDILKFMRAAFQMRRKTLVNNIMTVYKLDRKTVEEAIVKSDLDFLCRGETLSVKDFLRLYHVLFG